jgi:hypothetical protein
MSSANASRMQAQKSSKCGREAKMKKLTIFLLLNSYLKDVKYCRPNEPPSIMV